MTERLVYVSRVVRLPLLGADGVDVGRLTDVVFGPPPGGEVPPQVNGFVVAIQRRRVFVGEGRVGELTPEGARLKRGAVNMRQFELRPGETLATAQLFGRSVRGRRVVDIGIREAELDGWEVTTVALGGAGFLARRRTHEIVDWTEASELFAGPGVGRRAAAIGQLHPVQMASAIRALPLPQRRTLAAALEDERLADLLEELPEEEQVRIVEGLDLQRLARVLDEMEADDAADLLAEFSGTRQAELLGAMDPGEAEPVRRLLTYLPDTAGGLMNPEPIIMPPDASVAEALARVRDPDVTVAMAAQVFVCRAPTETPTGRYLGVAGFQRLLREAPSKPIGRCLDDQVAPIDAGASDRDVARRLAAYDAVALPVTDAGGRLVGAVTVDDVLDRLLPSDWRINYREETDHGSKRPPVDTPPPARGDSALRS
jgi:CBS domain-containing protein